MTVVSDTGSPVLGSFAFVGSQLGDEEYGTGERVFVYTHGLLMDSGMNRTLARTLAERGNRVALLDLLGHGRSDKPLRASVRSRPPRRSGQPSLLRRW